MIAILLMLACVASTAPDSARDSAPDSGDTCAGLPEVYFAWYPRDGLDILEVLITREGEFALALSNSEWFGEDCTVAGQCHEIHGNTLALQTVNTTSEVEIGASTWFTEARFLRWALVFSATDAAAAGIGCVGVGYPGCCTRDSRP